MTQSTYSFVKEIFHVMKKSYSEDEAWRVLNLVSLWCRDPRLFKENILKMSAEVLCILKAHDRSKMTDDLGMILPERSQDFLKALSFFVREKHPQEQMRA